MNNIIGYSSDTTNVMFGENNSVSQPLKSEVPFVQLVKCSCHLIHLVSSYAALKLPKSLEDLCRDVFNHFHCSSKRQAVYKEFQNFFNVEPLKLLGPGQTRWLSLQACVNRILEQFEALKHYFTLVTNEDPTHSNDRIHKSLNNKFMLAYLEFLSYQLERFNSFNLLFQSAKPLLHGLKNEVESLIKSIASDFMVIDYVKKTTATAIDPTCIRFQVPLKQIYLGMAATATLHEMEAGHPQNARPQDFEKFRTDCKNFFVEAILQIQKRFDLDAEIHTIIQCIVPANAASSTPPSLGPICQQLPYLKEWLDTSVLDREWRLHIFEPNTNPNMSWNEYWQIIKAAKTATGEQKYPTLSKFVSILASFPFSNASVERVFSALKQVKTDRRTSLKSSSLVSLLQYRMKTKNEKLSAAKLQPEKHLLELAYTMKANATDQEVKDLKQLFLDKFAEME